MSPPTLWRTAQARGVTLRVASDGTFRLHPGSLGRDEVGELKAHREALIAEWLFLTVEPVPAPIVWDPAVAEAILSLVVSLLAGPAFPPGVVWDEINRGQAAVDAAWVTQDLSGLVTAGRQWVGAVYQASGDADAKARATTATA